MNYIHEAIDSLKDYRDLLMSLENLEDEIKELSETFPGDSAISFSGAPGSSGLNTQDENVINKLIRLKEAKRQLAETHEKIDKMDKILGGLSDGKEGHENHENVLRELYIEGRKPENIAKELKCTVRNVFNIKSAAAKRLAILLYGVDAE